jgi:alanine racemase
VFTPPLVEIMGACEEADLTPCLGSLDELAAWIGRTRKPFHLEIDTGMARTGLPWNDAACLAHAAGLLAGAAGWEGVFTHFHSADTDPAATRLQWARLHEAAQVLGRRPRFVHGANSGAGALDPGIGGDFARPGIYLYGGRVGELVPVPVAALHARVIAVRRIAKGDSVSYGAAWRAEREATIATVAAGYADGVLRSLGNRGRAEIGGQVCPIAGRVTMDFTMIDAGDAPIAAGDVATFYGGRVSLDEQAGLAGTISYELLTAVGRRVVRRYQEDGVG